MNRTAIINLLIAEFDYHTYLEIGVQNPNGNFDKIRCNEKTGVDPFPLREDIIRMSSDDFFRELEPETRFDIIFIDGLHHCHQVLRDVYNALLHLQNGGTIVCHDMLPENENMQMTPMTQDQKHAWTGDCWKAWARLRMTEKNLDMTVLDTDFGVGVIQIGKQRLFTPSLEMNELDFSFFQRHKPRLMNVKRIEEVIEFA